MHIQYNLKAMLKLLAHDAIRKIYERDYVMVANLCDGFLIANKISMATIDGAKERYKQFNKSLLEIFSSSEDEKEAASIRIDANAETQKQRWINILTGKGIAITD